VRERGCVSVDTVDRAAVRKHEDSDGAESRVASRGLGCADEYVDSRVRQRRLDLSHSTRARKRRVRSSLGAEKNSSGGACSTIMPSSIISTALAT
jgi:hypothetical protein